MLADRCDAAGDPAQAVHWLGAAARQGSLIAIAQLGARTVLGAGCKANMADGKALLEFAATSRSGIAMRHLAALVLSGFDGTPDTDRAIDLTVMAAQAGDERSLAELDALIGGAGDWSPGHDRGKACASAAAILTPPKTETLCQAPPIQHLRGVASDALCAWLQTWCEPALARAGTIDRTTGGFRVEGARTNRSARIGLFDQPLELQLIKLRLAGMLGTSVDHFEGTNVLAYDAGEGFAVHHDYLDPAEPGFAAELARDGQRVATVLIALNAGYTAGETSFPALDINWRGEPGDGLYFRNIDQSGTPDRRTLHTGIPPASGRKWILSQWIRDRPQIPA